MKKMKQRMLAVLLSAACAASLAVPAFADGETSASFADEEAAAEVLPEPQAAYGEETMEASVSGSSQEEEKAYTLSIGKTEHGSVFFYEESEEIMEKSFAEGEKVILLVIPEDGYAPKTVTFEHDGITEAFVQNEEGLFESAMPAWERSVPCMPRSAWRWTCRYP